MMKTPRFLLPFVHGVDKFAIEQAILLAKSHQATLIPLVLIHVPEERRKKSVRLEYLQQSKDFLETVQQKADWYSVRIERLEVFTSDIIQSINLVASEMACEGILRDCSTSGKTGKMRKEREIPGGRAMRLRIVLPKVNPDAIKMPT